MKMRVLTAVILLIIIVNHNVYSNPKAIVITKEYLLNRIENFNIEVLNKRDNINYAEYEIDETKSLARPNIRLESNVARLDNPNMPSAMNNFSWSVSLRQPLYTYGKIRNALEIAKHYAEATEQDYKSTLRQTKYRGLMLFYTIRVLEHKKNLLLSTEKSLEQHYNNIRQRREVGTATLLDELTVQVNYKQIRPQIINMENQIINTKNDLKKLLNINLQTDVIIRADIEKNETIKKDKSYLINKSINENENIKMLNEQLKINFYQQGIASNTLRPNFYLISNYGGTGDKLNNFIDRKEYFIGVNMTFPLYDGRASKNELKKHKIQYDIINRQIELIKNDLTNGITQEFNNLKQYSEQISVNTLLVEQANEAYRIAVENFSMGLAINTDVIDAEKNKLNASIQLLESKYNYLISSITIKFLSNLSY